MSTTPPPAAENTGSGSPSSFLVRDGALLAGLILAAVLVFWVDSGIETEDAVIEIEEIDLPPPPPVVKMKLAVTPPEFDDMGTLLRGMGEGYENDQISFDDLLDANKLSRYDVVFLTCTQAPKKWWEPQLEALIQEGNLFGMKKEVREKLNGSLRRFVETGGTIYASDWQLRVIKNVFPEIVDSDTVSVGAKQMLTADVIDSGLKERLGADTISLNFDLDNWYSANFKSKQNTVYLRARFQAFKGGEVTAPLLVKALFGKGSIIFTSFHNEKQNSETEKELLEYLVLTTVTARVELDVADQMIQGGFSPESKSLLSTSSGQPSVTKSYVHGQPGDLEFVLAFENRGADLELVVKGPDGTTKRKAGTETVKIRITDAAEGTWNYTITARHLPYPNFPFSCSVWRK